MCNFRCVFVSLLCLSLTCIVGAHDHESALLAIQPSTEGQSIDFMSPAMEVVENPCLVDLSFVNAESEAPIPVVVRVYRKDDGRRILLRDLLPRATGLSRPSQADAAFSHMDSWSVMPTGTTIALPQERVVVEAFHGHNSTLLAEELDLRGKQQAVFRGKIKPLLERPFPWRGGNPHLHVQKMTIEEAERYSCEVALGDDYDIVFFSYLERAEADLKYTSNNFTEDDIERFTKRSGVLFGYGEEYRHNFAKNSEGYGHVMFLELSQLVLPASLGYAITRASNDDGSLRAGIEKARAQNATVLWCHGSRGLEDIPNWVAGLLDIQMIFDSGSLGTYENALYRYLNIGLHVPLATGTDWFFCDAAMTYVMQEEPLTREGWLDDLRNGRSFISNGPLLEFTVNGRPAGATLQAAAGDVVEIVASAACRTDFGALELVANGSVIDSKPAREWCCHYSAELVKKHTLTEPTWFAVRVTPFEGSYDRPAAVGPHFNEYGRPLFAHTSAVYADVDGNGVFLPTAAQSLLGEVIQDHAKIAQEGEFTTPEKRMQTLRIYEEAIAAFERYRVKDTVQ